MKSRIAGALLCAILAPPMAHASVEITAQKTKGITCSSGACVPSGKNAVLNVKDVANMLSAGDLTVFTGNGALNIEITAPFSWVSAHRLTLSAYQSVNFKAAVTVAGPGGLTITTNVAGNGGGVFFTGGKASFWDLSSSLIIDGNSYALVGDVATLASGIAADPSGFYALAKDHDAFADGIFTHSPIPTAFTGDFRGMGNVIDRLSIGAIANDPALGLFSEIDAPGAVSGVRLTNLSIQGGDARNVGGVAGLTHGTIGDTSVTGTIAGGLFTGGIASENRGVIANSQATVSVTGTAQWAGGIAGSNFDTVQSSRSAGSVQGGQVANAGGVVGYNQGIVVESSSSAAITVVPSGSAGGLVGTNNGGSIFRSFATGPVSADNGERRRGSRAKRIEPNLGGLVGWSRGRVVDNYARGSVTDPIGTGHKTLGTIGAVAGSVTQNDFALKQVYGTGALALRKGYVGGVVGYDYGTTDGQKANAYWDLDTTGVSDTSKGAGNIGFDQGLKGLSTDKLKGGLPHGFDPAVWGQSAAVNDGYPYLLANPPQ